MSKQDKTDQIVDPESGAIIRVDMDTGEILAEDGSTTGRTIEDLADDGHAVAYILQGDQDQLTLDVGYTGDAPQVIESLVKVKAFDRYMSGQFPIGTKVRFIVEAEVENVRLSRMHNRHGDVIGLERLHTLAVTGVRRETDA